MPSLKAVEISQILQESNSVELKLIRNINDTEDKFPDKTKIVHDENEEHNKALKEDMQEFVMEHDVKQRSQDNNKIPQDVKEMSQVIKSPYEEIMSKSKEPSYMTPIRNWERRMGFVTPLLWREVILITVFHAVAFAFIISMFISEPLKWQSLLFAYAVTVVAGFGVTGGVHRLWCHRSYKAKWPLKIILLICYSVAGQYNVYQWVRDHRVHHKFSDTSSDPHNSKRGFFFCHVGWLMMKKHPDVIKEGKKIDMSDITGDPLIQFYSRYFIWFKLFFCFVLPSLVPWLLWNESFVKSVLSQAFLRYVYTLNGTWTVNSFAHFWGNKPYDWKISPSENRAVSIIAFGEGWHNYHHTFPWDYKAAEFGKSNNFTTTLLNIFAKIGWAYDFKEASPELIKNVINSNRSKMFQQKS